MLMGSIKFSNVRTKQPVTLALLLLLAQIVYGQVSVQGKITDYNSNNPLTGVSVTEKGTSNGTTTNSDGVFVITVKDQQSVLVVSYVGYSAQEIPVGSKTSIDLRLAPASGQLNEVVVVGYGTLRRKEVTSAVATVNAEQFN